MILLIFLIPAYLICSIPFGLVLTKIFTKHDLTKAGSKNIGATNVARVAGKKLALATLLLDGLKAMLVVWLASYYLEEVELMLVAAVAVLAHIFPIYLKFKGGKGVATTLGVLLALDPALLGIAAAAWLLTFVIFRISSLAALVMLLSLIPAALYLEASSEQIMLYIFLVLLLLFRHRENLTRLFKGQEKKLF